MFLDKGYIFGDRGFAFYVHQLTSGDGFAFGWDGQVAKTTKGFLIVIVASSPSSNRTNFVPYNIDSSVFSNHSYLC